MLRAVKLDMFTIVKTEFSGQEPYPRQYLNYKTLNFGGSCKAWVCFSLEDAAIKMGQIQDEKPMSCKIIRVS